MEESFLEEKKKNNNSGYDDMHRNITMKMMMIVSGSYGEKL